MSFKKVATLIHLAVMLSACVSQIPTQTTETPTQKPSPTVTPTPTKIPTPLPTPTAEVNRNYPSPFLGLYYDSYVESDRTSITTTIDGVDFEKNNPGCIVPTVAGTHESQFNTLFNPKIPDEVVGYSIDNYYLMKYFSTQADEVSKIFGRLPDGTEVERVDNIWRMKKGKKYLFFIPIVPNQVDKPFGYPVICEQKGQLMMALVDKNGAMVDGATLNNAFRSAKEIADENGFGYCYNCYVPTSVSLLLDGKLRFFVKEHYYSSYGIVPFLITSFIEISPDSTAGIGPLAVDGISVDPVFDKYMDTWVWKNEKGEVRRFLDLETDRVFSQTESVKQQIIYQVDTDFGWEADLTQFNSDFFEGYERIGRQYLRGINDAYPGVVYKSNDYTKLVLKIVHGNYDDIADKNKVSSIKDLGSGGTEMSFFWPVYDKKTNTYTLKTYLQHDYLSRKNAISFYTSHMLSGCPTTNYMAWYIGSVGDVLKKSIQ